MQDYCPAFFCFDFYYAYFFLFLKRYICDVEYNTQCREERELI